MSEGGGGGGGEEEEEEVIRAISPGQKQLQPIANIRNRISMQPMRSGFNNNIIIIIIIII